LRLRRRLDRLIGTDAGSAPAPRSRRPPRKGTTVLPYIGRRLLLLIPTLLGFTVVIFLLIRLVPGTVVEQMLGSNALVTGESVEALRRYFGLDRPLYVQYLDWLGNLLVGDLGTSWRTGEPVARLVLAHLAVTAELALLSVLLATLVGIPVGILAALRQNSFLDSLLRIGSLFGLSMPVFWQATMLILILSRLFNWAPPLRWHGPLADPAANAQMMVLPAVALATVSAAVIVRMTRATFLDIMHQDYMRTARAKGLGERLVIIRHGLRNVLIPAVTVIGLQFGYLMGGIVVVEEVFTLPGLGRLVLNAIYQRDYPVVQGGVLAIALVFMLVNLVVDLLYAVLDPRIRYA
ncbi:MAG: ABC transporter permease, partial [Chloroflexota bacterium]|nr:ABC transporter permease [Chloroflexota bacterium]